jgi:NAD(P)H-hydrate repair Nnr-like enzyme with NAD(P)H-hydrate dehydratase domain
VWEAALAAVWMHGKAADEMVDAGTGPRGLMASELLPGIRSLLNQLDRG